MALSGELLAFLEELDELHLDIIGAINNLMWRREDGQLIEFRDTASIEDGRGVRRFAAKLVNAKQDLTRDLSNDLVQTFVNILGDETLNEHFTRRELQMIPGIVDRWKRLRALTFVALPAPKVRDYMRQAISCYLHGLPTAAVMLCRTVLQFALEEAIPSIGGVVLEKVEKRDWLQKLINLAQTTRVLSADLVATAHRVREAGNDAVHLGGCNDTTALATIRETGGVLTYIYRTPRNSTC
jgi:hypothetical protein